MAKESVFPAQINTSQQAHEKIKRKCFNCGSEDHIITDCPKPHDENKIKANKEKFLEAKQAKWNPCGRDGQRGRGNGGRGGRGGGEAILLADQLNGVPQQPLKLMEPE